MLLQEMKSPEVGALSKDVPIVIPVASLEQHGGHLPLFTDSFLCTEVVRRVSQRMGQRVLLAPLLWLGNSHHHMDFPGTVSAEPRTYLDILAGLVETFISHGFRRIVFLNGHGGNIVPSHQAIFEVRQRHRERRDLLLLSATYWQLGSKPAEIEPGFQQKSMGHACEWETSMMLRVASHLVGDYRNVEPVPFGRGFKPAERAWVTQDRSGPGHVGDPRGASAEKGELLFHLFSDDVVNLLERVVAWDGQSWDG